MKITERMRELGCNGFFENQLENRVWKEEDLQLARVTAVHKEGYKIVTENGDKRAKLKGGVFYYEAGAEYPVTGDFILVKNNTFGEDVIFETLKRKSKLSRFDSFHEKEQLLAANFDYVLIMMSLNQDFNLKKLERYLAISWESGGTPVVVFTKADLCEDYKNKMSAAGEVAFGADMFAISSHTGFGLSDLAEYLKPERTLVLLGSSGVGKSSFVNAVTEEAVMKIREIREEDARGRHTTTHRQMIFLKSGAMLIDTPGIREVGMWNAKEGFDTTFSDITELMRACRFSDCTHQNEPGCKVREAICAGGLSSARWNNYLKLQKEIQYTKKKQELAQMRIKNKKKKNSKM